MSPSSLLAYLLSQSPFSFLSPRISHLLLIKKGYFVPWLISFRQICDKVLQSKNMLRRSLVLFNIYSSLPSLHTSSFHASPLSSPPLLLYSFIPQNMHPAVPPQRSYPQMPSKYPNPARMEFVQTTCYILLLPHQTKAFREDSFCSLVDEQGEGTGEYCKEVRK